MGPLYLISWTLTAPVESFQFLLRVLRAARGQVNETFTIEQINKNLGEKLIGQLVEHGALTVDGRVNFDKLNACEYTFTNRRHHTRVRMIAPSTYFEDFFSRLDDELRAPEVPARPHKPLPVGACVPPLPGMV